MADARAKGTHTKEEWLALLARFDFKCAACRWHDTVGKDHIKPICAGGSDKIENIQPLCRLCNSIKGFKTFNWVEYRDKHGMDAPGWLDDGWYPNNCAPVRLLMKCRARGDMRCLMY